MFSPLVPKGSTILVTGANGFIASHVIHQLLEVGFIVRGSVRSEAKCIALSTHFERCYGQDRFELSIVPEIAPEGAFDEALKGRSLQGERLRFRPGMTFDVSGIVHLATAATFTSQPNSVVQQTIAGALDLFTAASKQQSIKSIVYTSDSFAVLLPQPNQLIHITNTTYNEASVTVARDPSSAERIRKEAWDPSKAFELNVYAAAKVAAEKAIWHFVESQNPHFQVSTVLPNVNIGPSMGGLPLSSTGTFVPNLFEGKTDGLIFPAQHYVNVRGCARLHVAALIDRTQDRKRIFATAAPFNWNDVLAIIRKLRPDRHVINDMPNLGQDLSSAPNEEPEELLKKHFGHGWTSLEESVKQNLQEV